MAIRRSLLLCLGLVLGSALSARAGDPQVEARDVVVKYFAAVKASDWGAMWDLIAEESRSGQSREEFTKAREGGLSATLGKAIQERASYQVGEVRIAEGGTSGEAQVNVRMPDLSSGGGSMPTPAKIAQAPLNDLQRTLQLVVESGAWKVVRPRPALSPEQMERFNKAVRDSAERARSAPPPGKPD